MQLPSPQTTTQTALRYGVPTGVVASVLCSVVLLAVGSGPPFSLDGPAVAFVAVGFFLVTYALGPIVVFGMPVVLYLRFGLRAPLPVFVGVFAAWELLGGGPQVSLLLVVFQDAPTAVLYGVVGTLEWYVRDRRGTLPPGPTPTAEN